MYFLLKLFSLKGRQRDLVSLSWFTPQMSTTQNQSGARPKSEAWNSTWISHVGRRDLRNLNQDLLTPVVCISRKLELEVEPRLKTQAL